MKAIKYILGAGALIAALASCTKEIEGEEPAVVPEVKMVKVTLTASQGLTKTSMSGNQGSILWSAGDQISVTYSTGTYTFTLESGAGEKSAIFSGEIPEGSGDPVSATYPASGVALGDPQTYLEGTFADNTLPMYAEYNNGLHFVATASVVMTPAVDGSFAGNVTLSYTVGENNYAPTMAVTAGDTYKYLIFVVVPGARNFTMSYSTNTVNCVASAETEVAKRYRLSEAVAKIGDEYYSSLFDAVWAAEEEQTITLIKDVEDYVTVHEDQNVIVDLNGHNIISSVASAVFTNEGTLKIMGEGDVTREDNRGYVIDNKGTLELAGGNYKKTAGTSMNALLHNTGAMTISGGTYSATYKTSSADNIYSPSNEATLSITGGEFLTATLGTGNIVITGGTFASTAVAKYLAEGYGLNKGLDGKYHVSDGYIVKDNKNNYYTSFEDAFTTATTYLSLLVDVDGDVTVPEDATINYLYLNNHAISGNVVNNNIEKVLILGESATAKATSEKGIVSGTLGEGILVIGGKFVHDPVASVNKYEYKTVQEEGYFVLADKTAEEKAAALAADGIKVTTGSGSSLAYFTSLQAAWDANTSTTSCNFTFVADIEEDVVRVKKSAPIFKLEGHNFSGSMDTRVDGANKYFNINGAGTATLNEVFCGNMTIDNKANVVIKGGIVTGTLTVKSGCSLSITGGTFSVNPSAYVPEGLNVVDNGNGTWTVQEPVAAMVGGVSYANLADAIANVPADGTVSLAADVDDNIVVPADKSFTLDLNGKTLNGKQETKKPSILNNGTLILQNGTIERSGAGSASYYVIENQGNLTLGENLNVTGSASSSLINNNSASAVMTINGGTYTQTGAFIVLKNDLGTVEINDGTFSTASDKNVLNNWDTMTINGGTFTGCIFNGAYDTDNNVLTITDGTFNSELIRTYLGNGKTDAPINIEGGNFTNSAMKFVGTQKTEADTDIQVSITGGTFRVDPSKFVAASAAVIAKDGVYTVVGEGIKTALAQATSGSTVMLLSDCTESLTVGEGVTLDCKGYTVSNTVKVYSNVTVKNATIRSGSCFDVARNGLAVSGVSFADVKFWCTAEWLFAINGGNTFSFNNCEFHGGMYWAHSDSDSNNLTFTNCKFVDLGNPGNGDKYGMYIGHANNSGDNSVGSVIFRHCEFEGGKIQLLHQNNIEYTNCKFKDTCIGMGLSAQTADGKASAVFNGNNLSGSAYLSYKYSFNTAVGTKYDISGNHWGGTAKSNENYGCTNSSYCPKEGVISRITNNGDLISANPNAGVQNN